MAALGAVMLLRVLFSLFVIFSCKRVSYVNATSTCYSLHGEDVVQPEGSYFASTLWVHYRGNVNFRLKCMSQILLILSGDIELCPGPEVTYNIPELDDLYSSKGIKIVHQNIRGLLGKKDLLADILCKNPVNICCITETLTSAATETSFYEIPGYSFEHKCRQTGTGGGVGIFIKSEMISKRRYDLEKPKIECIWMEVCLHKAKSFLVACLYRPPDSSKHLHENFNNLLDETCSLTLLRKRKK